MRKDEKDPKVYLKDRANFLKWFVEISPQYQRRRALGQEAGGHHKAGLGGFIAWWMGQVGVFAAWKTCLLRRIRI